MRPQLTKEEFKTYLLIYAAYADYNFDASEEAFIIQHSSKDAFDQMHDLFNSNSDYNSLQLVARHKAYFLDDTKNRKKVYDLILSLFNVDGEYTRGEKTFLEFLDKVVDSNFIV